MPGSPARPRIPASAAWRPARACCLPASVRGPVDLAALARFATSCRAVTVLRIKDMNTPCGPAQQASPQIRIDQTGIRGMEWTLGNIYHERTPAVKGKMTSTSMSRTRASRQGALR